MDITFYRQPRKIRAEAELRCQNCDRIWKEDQLIWPIPDLHLRVEPGDTVPDGECPDCGAVVFREDI